MQTRGSGAKVSFLFFIDIMMCISGVMLFVIMLLVLDISNGTGYSAGAEKEAKASTIALQKQIDALFPQLAAMRAAKASGVKVEAPAAAPLPAASTVDPKELQKMLDEKNAERQKLEAELAELEREKGKLGDRFKRVDFHFNDADKNMGARDVIIVECSAAVAVVQAPRDAPHAIKVEDLSERVTQIFSDLSVWQTDKIVVLLLVKPSDFVNAGLILKALRQKGYQTGIEPLEEERTAIRW